MTGRTTDRPPSRSRSRMFWIAFATVALALFVGANAHLVAVSFSSQPDCVPHLKAPVEGAAQFRAAKSSC